MQDVYTRPPSFNPPAQLENDILVQRIDLSDWPLYKVSFRTNDQSTGPRRAMLYIHGGAFYREIDPFHWKFIFQAARETGLDVIVPIYPLLPRPTATAGQVIPALVDICRHIEEDVVNIIGDSAGGGMTLATMHHMLKVAPDIAKKVTSVVLISPVLDITLSHPECERLASRDPWLGLGLRALLPLWCADTSPSDSMASPLHGEIAKLPPLLLLSGTDDILNADARRLNAKFQGKDSDECLPGSVQLDKFTYVEQADMIHVYPLLPHWEGGQARKLIMQFIHSHLT